jgi:hypothetical protein
VILPQNQDILHCGGTRHKSNVAPAYAKVQKITVIELRQFPTDVPEATPAPV